MSERFCAADTAGPNATACGQVRPGHIRRALVFGVLTVGLLTFTVPGFAQRQMERLGRGLVALRTGTTTAYLSWRLLGTEPEDIGFNVYRVIGTATNKLTTTPLTNVTCYTDSAANFSYSITYIVRPVIGGTETGPVGTYTLPAGAPIRQYIPVPLQVPPGGTTPDGTNYTYSANDASVGDLDGDGEYEIVLKWDPSNSKDNAQAGYTGPVIIDAYKLDGTRLWRINLGINIRAGAHYTQFMVYDLDGDGRAEMVCKTAPGTVDGVGNFVLMPGDDPYADYRNSSGYILTGPEYLTVFDGLTGAALWTTNYYPPRGTVSSWGDSYGNRVDRFLACVAFLDGVRPSVIMCRGYYTRAVLAAYDWRGGVLTRRWVFDTWNGYSTYEGQGNHNLSVGDVDGDGKDEIVYGACAIDHDGRGLYTTGLGHGDAMHLSDMDTDRPGLEVWDVHETASQYAGGDFRHAGTGYIYFGFPSSDDCGRGCAAPLLNTSRYYQLWSSRTGGLFDTKSNYMGSTPSSINFVVYWDADLARELLDGTTISKYGVGALLTASGCSANNGTKATPCLSADLMGDWREEVIWRTTDSSELRIYFTTNAATNRLYTLMHDTQYRLAIAWQNVAYNQPPHPGFYLGPGMDLPPVPLFSDADLVWRGSATNNVWDAGITPNWRTNLNRGNDSVPTTFWHGASVLFDLTGTNTVPVQINSTLAPGRLTVHSPFDYVFQGTGAITGSMQLWKAGKGVLTIKNTNTYTGTTHVRDGTLAVDGLLTASPVVVRGRGVWGPATLAGHGRLGAGATIINGGALAPGRTNLGGVLVISNKLALTNATLLIDLSSDPTGTVKTNDAVLVMGNVEAGGTNSIVVTALDGVINPGDYPVLIWSGTYTGSSITNWGVLGLGQGSYQLSLLSTGLVLRVLDPGLATRHLRWRGDGTANLWDAGLSTNWLDPDGLFTVFLHGNTAEFDDAGSNNVPVTLSGTLYPGRTIVSAVKDYRFTGTGMIAGSNVLEKTGAGRLIISNANTYTGGTVLKAGVLQLGSIDANMSALGTGPITFEGGTLQFAGYGGNTGTSWGGHTNDWFVPHGQTGTVLMPPRFGWGYPFTSRLTGNGELRVVTDYVRCGFWGDWSQFYGIIRVGPRAGSAEFRLGHSAGMPNARLFLSNGITMYQIWGANAVIDLGALEGDTGATLGPGNGSSTNPTWRVGWRGEDAEFKGRILNAGITSVTKVGGGTWRLSGTNAYSGETVVEAGTLLVNGDNSGATNAVRVLPGACLGGTGTLGGTVLLGGRLEPGDNGIGTLRCLSTVTMSNASMLVIELGAGVGSDRLSVQGTLSCAGTLVVTNIGGPIPAGTSFQLFQAGQITGRFGTVVLPPLSSDLAWYLGRLYTDGTITVIARPLLSASVDQNALRMTATGLPPGTQCVLLATTNITLPLASWTVLSTNLVGADGTVTFTNAITPDQQARFFTIRINQ